MILARPSASTACLSVAMMSQYGNATDRASMSPPATPVLPGAINLPLKQLDRETTRLLHRGRPVIV